MRRDGVARPGTDLFGDGSEQFDRSRLQHMIEDTTSSALAWQLTGRSAFAEHGAKLVRRWFIDAETRMHPHLQFAQVRMGYDGNQGASTGIVDMRDLPLLLDALRLLERSGALGAADVSALQSWMRAYRDWLAQSAQGKKACLTETNVGTYYELQWAAVSVYLGDFPELAHSFLRARNRMLQQFDPDGSQPYELARANSLHYCCFNLQGWLSLATLAARCGDDLWTYRSAPGTGLRAAVDWLTSFEAERRWPYPQNQAFDWRRATLLKRQYDVLCSGAPIVASTVEPDILNRQFSTADGFRLYWYL